MNLSSQYAKLKNEVEVFLESVHQALEQNPSAKTMYKGCVIMYSPLRESPPFLFIGINPGDEQKEEEQPKENLEPSDGFEYINALENDYDYTLAKETRDLFEKAGMLDCLDQSVKTNFYYFATSKKTTFSTLFSLLGEDMNKQLHANAFKWTRQMIEMVKPKIIICEGITTFDNLSVLYYGVPGKREGVCGYFELPDKTPVIGYSRYYSNIKDKCFVADFLRKKCK